MRKTYMADPAKLKKTWYHIDAKNVVLGRAASKIAMILMGKHKPTYTPYTDAGDFVIVTNVRQLKVTGKKFKEKLYYSWSGYPGGLKIRSYETVSKKTPAHVLMLAVRRMLPKSSLGRNMLKKLKVYEGEEHPHQAQKPEKLEVQ